MHYFRQYRGARMDGPPRKPEPNRTGRCAVEGCSKPPRGRYCVMHQARIDRHGNTDRVGPRSPTGQANPMWTDNPGYHTVHERLRRWRGSAHGCERCGKAEPAAEYQWALDFEKAGDAVRTDEATGLVFSVDLDHYVPACVPCHKHMDLARLQRGQVRPAPG